MGIGAEAWRGLRDGGEALHELASAVNTTNPSVARVAKALAKTMSDGANALLVDVRESMRRSAFRARPAPDADVATCHPYVAGARTCGFLADAASSRDSEGWRTYSEALYSGALEPHVTSEILQWHRHARAEHGGSRLMLGVLTGSGGDNSNGHVLETFTLFGWGYGERSGACIAAPPRPHHPHHMGGTAH
jgi:hypothetical protein